MNNHHSISLQEVDLGYQKPGSETLVLKNICLDFFSGNLVGIVGLNGVGKSTLLKSICGLLPVLKGRVFLSGKDISELSLSELAKQVSVVLTEKIGGFNLTAYDLVAAGQMPYTNSFYQLKAEHHQIIHRALKTCGIEEYQYKALHELSDGLFQKASIARAIAQQTPIMLLDEPTAFLDYASKHKLFSLLKDLTLNENKCILVSSHDLDLVLKYCNRVLIVQPDRLELVSVSEAPNNLGFKEIGGGYI